jgi:hypothetical protein
MNFVFLQAEVIRKAFGVDIYSDVYIKRHWELLFELVSGLLSKPRESSRLVLLYLLA